ncbi:MAG: DUF4367 domain-containing protein [Muricomes sp.]
MNPNKRMSLQEEVDKEAEKIEQEISADPSLKDLKVSERMEQEFFLRIKEYEERKAAESRDVEALLSEKDREALRRGRENMEREERGEHLYEVNKEYHKHLNQNKDKNGGGKKVRPLRMPRQKRLLVALVAVMVLVVAIGITSVGSKSYLKGIFDGFLGTQSRTVINVKDMEKQNTEDGTEISAYNEVKEKLGIMPVQLANLPETMKLENITIDEEQKVAQLFYNYDGQIIRYIIYLNDADSSFGQRQGDKLKDRFKVEVAEQSVDIEEYEIEETEKSTLIASFSYAGANYQLKGVMNREEFIEIIKNLIFFDKNA